MILVDTSVWIDYFNGHTTPETDRLAFAIAENQPLVLPGIVVTEIKNQQVTFFASLVYQDIALANNIAPGNSGYWFANVLETRLAASPMISIPRSTAIRNTISLSQSSLVLPDRIVTTVFAASSISHK